MTIDQHNTHTNPSDDPGGVTSQLMSALDVDRVATVAPEVLTSITILQHADSDLRAFERPMGPEEAVATLRGLEDLRRRLESLHAATLSVLERTGIPQKYGHPTTKALLQNNLHLSSAEANRRVRMARSLGGRVDMAGQALPPAYPTLAGRLHAGSLSVEQVDAIATTCHRLPPTMKQQHGQQVEEQLADLAPTVQIKDLHKLTKRVIDHLDPDGTCPRDEADPDARFVSITEMRNGDWTLRGQLAPMHGALLHGLLTTRTNHTDTNPDGSADPANSADPAGTEAAGGLGWAATLGAFHTAQPHQAGASDPAGSSGGVVGGVRADGQPVTLLAGQPVNAGRKRLYARFSQLLTRLSSHETAHGPAYALVITATAEQVAAGRGEVETQAGTLVDLTDVLSLSPGGQFYYHSTAKGSRSVNIRTVKRAADKHQLAVLKARDQGCTFPDCDRPAGYCDAHHIIPHANGGPTDINNLTLVCSYHHHWHEKEGWQATMTGGLPAWIPPPSIDPDQTPIYHSKFRTHLTHLPPPLFPPQESPPNPDTGTQTGRPPDGNPPRTDTGWGSQTSRPAGGEPPGTDTGGWGGNTTTPPGWGAGDMDTGGWGGNATNTLGWSSGAAEADTAGGPGWEVRGMAEPE